MDKIEDVCEEEKTYFNLALEQGEKIFRWLSIVGVIVYEERKIRQ